MAAGDAECNEGGSGVPMLRGTVFKWFGDRSYGFISPLGGGANVFVSRNAIPGQGALIEGKEVEYMLETDTEHRNRRVGRQPQHPPAVKCVQGPGVDIRNMDLVDIFLRKGMQHEEYPCSDSVKAVWEQRRLQSLKREEGEVIMPLPDESREAYVERVAGLLPPLCPVCTPPSRDVGSFWLPVVPGKTSCLRAELSPAEKQALQAGLEHLTPVLIGPTSRPASATEKACEVIRLGLSHNVHGGKFYVLLREDNVANVFKKIALAPRHPPAVTGLELTIPLDPAKNCFLLKLRVADLSDADAVVEVLGFLAAIDVVPRGLKPDVFSELHIRSGNVLRIRPTISPDILPAVLRGIKSTEMDGAAVAADAAGDGSAARSPSPTVCSELQRLHDTSSLTAELTVSGGGAHSATARSAETCPARYTGCDGDEVVVSELSFGPATDTGAYPLRLPRHPGYPQHGHDGGGLAHEEQQGRPSAPEGDGFCAGVDLRLCGDAMRRVAARAEITIDLAFVDAELRCEEDEVVLLIRFHVRNACDLGEAQLSRLEGEYMRRGGGKKLRDVIRGRVLVKIQPPVPSVPPAPACLEPPHADAAPPL